jgi:Flp pilus assembly protein TadG
MMAAFVALLASARLLLIPLAILAFLLFLLILGTIALGIALGLISALSWIVRAPRRRLARPRSSRAAKRG